MLFKKTVSLELLTLLQQLFSCKEMDSFVLVGGTALSLQIGHRRSIDIDLFSVDEFDIDELLNFLREKSFNFKQQNRFKGSVLGFINGIKADFIRHPYPWVANIKVEKKIRLASLEDIAAMKLNAIVGNGTRLKDFIDIVYLSKYMSLTNMLDNYEKKYPDENGVMALKSLCYFDDINFNVELDLMDKEMDWKVAEKRLIEMVKFPDCTFS